MGGRQKTTLFSGTSTIGEELKKTQGKESGKGKKGKRSR